MQKLKMNLDTLCVESFETVAEPRPDARGTVHGREAGAGVAEPSFVNGTICWCTLRPTRAEDALVC